MESVAQQALETLHRFREALQFLERDHPPSVLFMPDIVRDGILIVPGGRDLVSDLSPENEKNRIRGYPLFMKGGGHAFIAGYAAAVFRERMNVGVQLAARIYGTDEHDLVQGYMVSNPQLMGASPIDTSFVSILPGNRTPFNLVIEQKGGTRILTGEQPVLKLSELGELERQKLLDALRNADIVAALSLRAPSLRELIQEIIDGNLTIKELFSDCTSGDRASDNYQVLDILRLGKSGHSPLTLLSINSNEVRVYAALLALEREGLRADLDKKSQEDFERIMEGKLPKDSIEAAAFLNEELSIPLLFHSSDGSCILDKEGKRRTLFVPAVDLRILPDNFVGAGDTLCGGMALALAVKQRLENSHINTPRELHLTYEDCLLIANLITCYRLETVGILSRENRHHEWHTAVGTISRIIEWAKDTKLKPVSVIVPYSSIIEQAFHSDLIPDNVLLNMPPERRAKLVAINGFGRIGRLTLNPLIGMGLGVSWRDLIHETAYAKDFAEQVDLIYSYMRSSPRPYIKHIHTRSRIFYPRTSSKLYEDSIEHIIAVAAKPVSESRSFSVPVRSSNRDSNVDTIVDDAIKRAELSTSSDKDMPVAPTVSMADDVVRALSILDTFGGLPSGVIVTTEEYLSREQKRKRPFDPNATKNKPKHHSPPPKRLWRRRH